MHVPVGAGVSISSIRQRAPLLTTYTQTCYYRASSLRRSCLLDIVSYPRCESLRRQGSVAHQSAPSGDLTYLSCDLLESATTFAVWSTATSHPHLTLVMPMRQQPWEKSDANCSFPVSRLARLPSPSWLDPLTRPS